MSDFVIIVFQFDFGLDSMEQELYCHETLDPGLYLKVVGPSSLSKLDNP